jgi:nucleoside-diphosphate-sugar epimerase
MNISLFRPRLIIGPGRLGILEKLFKLIDWNLPVPMIGSGRNPYQFISVFDCAEAARLAWKAGVPNEAYNLGSLNPPPVRKLLGDLIKHAGSKSILVPTPGWAVKRTLDLLDLDEHADHGSRAVSDRRRGLRARRLQGRAPARLGAAVPRRGHADRRLHGISRQEGRPRCVAAAHSVPAE